RVGADMGRDLHVLAEASQQVAQIRFHKNLGKTDSFTAPAQDPVDVEPWYPHAKAATGVGGGGSDFFPAEMERPKPPVWPPAGEKAEQIDIGIVDMNGCSGTLQSSPEIGSCLTTRPQIRRNRNNSGSSTHSKFLRSSVTLWPTKSSAFTP